MTERWLLTAVGESMTHDGTFEEATELAERSWIAARGRPEGDLVWLRREHGAWGLLYQEGDGSLVPTRIQVRALGAGDAAGADPWRDAFERLLARVQLDTPNDGSGLPAPEDEFWAERLDGLLAFADELHRRTETRGRAPSVRHFSPGRGEYDLPDHDGPEEACALSDCVLRRARHEAAGDIQALTSELREA